MEDSDYLNRIGTDESCKFVMKFICGIVRDKPPDIKSDDEERAFMFLLRHCFTSITLWNVFWPKHSEELYCITKDSHLLDSSSALILVRNLYESFLILYYLLGSKDTSEKELRILVWDRSFHLDIEGFKKNLKTKSAQLSDSMRKGLDTYDKEFKEITARIERNSTYCDYDLEKQKRIMQNRGGRLKDFASMARDAGINENFHHSLYGYISAYAHPKALGFKHLFSGDPRFILDRAKFYYELVTALLLNFAKRFIFSKEINNSRFLSEIIKWHLGIVENFDEINKWK